MLRLSVCGLLLATTMVFLIVTRTASESSSLTGTTRFRRSLIEIDNPADVLGVLAYLQSSILRAQEMSNEKRGLDLGLSRGFSGSQAAKHRMGLAAAKFAGGPGRRRRDVGQNQ
ncbi:diuretic hormone class 2-like [Limulus polyphemus]|uniref:Diuretic hormone class 2-like n=1 Tax=Limulus polyphemus TaxID=6850 RepID=A0ABM1SE23_LIMPO|nr:diuretic hormone class 2-like [Limulus polyphemus]XP_022241878.1 diuretic hormone class 2-like [Limulus polyphemus]XP_022241879.1 diuretic hormone class 2-like [Limulus polyphemus]